MAERTAKTIWKGTLTDGQGELTLESSGLLSGTPVTWASRTEEPGGTSPEELLAGAQAACYAMALSNTLAQQGTPPDTLEISATCAFEKKDGGFAVTTMDIAVRGAVPGMDATAFKEAAETAKEGCPISNAIRENVQIGLTAQLA
jgi:osmotically inducible protein OsmC